MAINTNPAMGNEYSETGNKIKNERTLDRFDIILLTIEKYFILILLPLVIVVLFMLGMFSEERSDLLIGYGIVVVAIFVYIIFNLIRETPEKQQWLISVFKRYHVTWLPGLHLVWYPIMRIDYKVTIDSTKVLDVFMEEGSHKIEFDVGSAGLRIKVMIRATDAYKAAYDINLTDEDIRGIEVREEDRGNISLSEMWMYFAAIKIEDAVRGVCGKYTIDDAIKAKSIQDSQEGDDENKSALIAQCVVNANNSLKDYGIVAKQITFSAITLSPEIAKARDDIYIAQKDAEKQTKILEKQKVEADGEVVLADGKNRALWKIIGDMEDEEGNPLKSRMSFADAMQYIIVQEAVKHIGDVTVVSSGGSVSIPENIATQIGAEFGVGFGAVKRGDRKKEKGDDEQ